MAITSKWRQHIEAWQRSGLSQGDYCAQQQINVRTFTARLSDYRKLPAAESAALIPVQIEPPATAAIVFNHVQGHRLDLSNRANLEPRIRLKKPTSRKSPMARSSSTKANARVSQDSSECGTGRENKPDVAASSKAHNPKPMATTNVAVADGRNAGRPSISGMVAITPGQTHINFMENNALWSYGNAICKESPCLHVL